MLDRARLKPFRRVFDGLTPERESRKVTTVVGITGFPPGLARRSGLYSSLAEEVGQFHRRAMGAPARFASGGETFVVIHLGRIVFLIRPGPGDPISYLTLEPYWLIFYHTWSR